MAEAQEAKRATYIKYVPHAMIADYKAKGWIECGSLDGTHHGHYAIMMQWTGEGEPPK